MGQFRLITTIVLITLKFSIDVKTNQHNPLTGPQIWKAACEPTPKQAKCGVPKLKKSRFKPQNILLFNDNITEVKLQVYFTQ